MTDNTKKVAQGFSKNNTIDISAFRIELQNNEVIDLKGTMAELDIYRDMFGLGITATLIFKDVLNITNNGPILGGERVLIRYKSPMYDDYTELMFRVSLVAERVPVSPTNCMVKLELCSESLYFGLAKSSSVGYNNQYSSLVKKLWESLEIDVPIFIDETQGIFKGCTNHSTNILETIRVLANRSKSSDNLHFLFFEDYEGMNFASWSKILAQTASIKLLLQIQGTEEDITKDWKNIYDIQFDDNSRDSLEFMRSGLGNLTESIFDINSKELTQTKRSFENFTQSLTSNKIAIRDSEKSSRVYSGFKRDDGSNQNMFEREIVNYLMQYHTTTICNVGDNQARLGQLIELDLPSPQLPDPKNPKKEMFFSGKYLVTGIKDTIRQNEFRTYRKLVKESLLNEV